MCHDGDGSEEVRWEIPYVDYKTMEEIKSFKGKKNKFKRLLRQYDVFLCSTKCLRSIARLKGVGVTLFRSGKNQKIEGSIQDMVEKVRRSLRVKIKWKTNVEDRKIPEHTTNSKIGLDTNTVEELIKVPLFFFTNNPRGVHCFLSNTGAVI